MKSVRCLLLKINVFTCLEGSVDLDHLNSCFIIKFSRTTISWKKKMLLIREHNRVQCVFKKMSVRFDCGKHSVLFICKSRIEWWDVLAKLQYFRPWNCVLAQLENQIEWVFGTSNVIDRGNNGPISAADHFPKASFQRNSYKLVDSRLFSSIHTGNISNLIVQSNFSDFCPEKSSQYDLMS